MTVGVNSDGSITVFLTEGQVAIYGWRSGTSSAGSDTSGDELAVSGGSNVENHGYDYEGVGYGYVTGSGEITLAASDNTWAIVVDIGAVEFADG